MLLKTQCDWCGKQFEKYECRISKHNFCSRPCLANFSNKTRNPERYMELKDYSSMSVNMAALNTKLNPTRMNAVTREKLRKARSKDVVSGYKKLYGRHEHRAVAEQILGRPLEDGEVVHHIDGNKNNNDPKNLRIFRSQSEHAKFHVGLNAVLKMLNS